MMNLDYRYLKAFQYTAETLNFSKAAEQLKIAQSAVSRQIKLLEEGLGEQLILRSSKKVVLTEKGNELHKAITNFEKNLDEVFQIKIKTLKIGILHGLLENWFIKVIKDLTKKFNYQYEIEVNTPEELVSKIESGKIDLAITTINAQSDLVTSLKIFEEKPVLISKNPIQIKDIQKNTWIIYDDNDYLLKNYKIPAKDIIKVNSITSIIKLVKEGVGVAIVPMHAISSMDKLNMVTVKGMNKENIYLNTPNLKKSPVYIDELKQIIEKSFN